MNISSLMSRQLAEMQHVLQLNLLKSQMATKTAHVTVMLEDMAESQPTVQAPHPTLGKMMDVSV